MKSESPGGSLQPDTTVDGGYRRLFMVTICRLTKAVSIKPPRSPQLASFTFFTTCVHQPDGSERLYLHMGYFATLSDAQQWAQRMRTRYPNAIAMPALLPRLQPPSSDAPVPQIDATAATPAGQEFPPVKDDPLSDSRVMRILATRVPGTIERGTGEQDGTQVQLLRPDDTQTRRILKEAVVEGVPVPFAVQLEWSQQPIAADRVPRLDIFKGYTLYRTEKRRGGRSCYFLRLGFFQDAVSAKELACRVRSTFGSAAVVPVTEQELLHADEARIDIAAPAGPYHDASADSADSAEIAESADGPDSAKASSTHRFTAPGVQTFFFTLEPESTGNTQTASKKAPPPAKETLEEALKALAQRESWREPDPLSDTGVRHKKVTLEQHPAKSAQKQKPPIRLA